MKGTSSLNPRRDSQAFQMKRPETRFIRCGIRYADRVGANREARKGYAATSSAMGSGLKGTAIHARQSGLDECQSCRSESDPIRRTRFIHPD